MPIKLLPENIANQIAAGEVIERPASVVKEILENSLDAGASVIEITIDKAGLQLIRINDDGKGIAKEDLKLAITQHATSKIEQLSDLENIASLGFRGEALASIHSVADLKITSKLAKADSAWQITPANTIAAAAHPNGTTVEVRDLFAKVPVRRRFLKSKRTEFSHIEDVVRRMALSTFSVAFKLSHNGKTIFHLLPATNEVQYRSRLAKLLNKSFAENSVAIDQVNQDLRLWGWVLPEEWSRAHADQQYFFVNGRIVKDRVLQHALRIAFADCYQQARYPAYVLYLECPSHQVDVNVHPTKHEVRFVEPRLVHDFVVSTLQRQISEKVSEPDRVNVIPQSSEYTLKEPTAVYTINKAKPTSSIKAIAFIAHKYIIALQDGMLKVIHYPRAVRYLNKKCFDAKLAKAQPLLIPETIECDGQMVEAALAREHEWQEYGIGLRQIGPNVISLRSLPPCLHGATFKPILAKLVQLTDNDAVINYLSEQSVLQETLSVADMQTIVEKLFSDEHALLPDNKIIVALNAEQLEQLFK